MNLFDSHCHLDDDKFDDKRDEIIKDILLGIKGCITAGYSLEASKKAVEISKKYKNIYSICGISPNDIPQTEQELWKDIDEIYKLVQENIESKKIVAIGEIGLDYYWEKDLSRREFQKQAFKKQIEIANKLNLPIVIHTREAVNDTLEILKNNEVKRKGVFHCCPLNRELVKEALKLGYYISLAGPVTFKNSKNAEKIIDIVPNDRILIETDSPYLAPEPVRGTVNNPKNVKYVAMKIAEVKKLTLEEVANMTYENVKECFGFSKIPVQD